MIPYSIAYPLQVILKVLLGLTGFHHPSVHREVDSIIHFLEFVHGSNQ